MGELGLFPQEYRGELIDGEIFDLAPVGSNHAGCLKWLTRYFSAQFSERYLISVQDPISLGDFSEPQPDFALLKPQEDFYRTRHPNPDEILLVIEVADSSSGYDREVKAPLYARYAIPEYWLVDLSQGVVEVFSLPAEGGYRSLRTWTRGEQLESPTLSGISLCVSDLLG